jgi:hypothetical protein
MEHDWLGIAIVWWIARKEVSTCIIEEMKCHLVVNKTWKLKNLKSHIVNLTIPNFGLSIVHMTYVCIQGCTIMYDTHTCVLIIKV